MHANDDERTAGMTKPAAKYVVIEFIEADCNRRRPHSTIGYQMPARAMESFMELLDEYIRFYNERRKKQSLGWMSPMQCRISKGLEWV